MSTQHDTSRKLFHRVGWASILAGPARVRAFQGIGASIAVVFALACLAPTAANAAFTRKFERQIFRSETVGGHLFTEPCSEAEATAPGSLCLRPGGVAVDSADNLWVGNGHVLDEFEPASAGNKPVPLSPEFKVGVDGSVAVQSAPPQGNGDFYVAEPEGPSSSVEVFEPSGNHLQTWRKFANPDVVVDNNPSSSLDPAACGQLPLSLGECTVYVGERGGIVKLNSKGEERSFSCGAACGYIGGAKGGTITGHPGEPECGQSFEAAAGGVSPPLSVAVDAQGDIFVAVPSCGRVFEYLPTGEYKRELNFGNPEVPRINEILATPHRLAVDPASGNLLVSVQVSGGEAAVGAIYEFDAETGKFVGEITQAGEGKAIEAPDELAVDQLGDVYLVDAKRHVVDVWGPLGPPTPTVKLGAVSARTETSAVLNGSVDPEGNSVGACHFQYVTEATFKHNVEVHHGLESEGFAELGVGGGEVECEPAPGSLEANDTPQPVHAAVTGLTSAVTYRYRLLATTAGGGEAQSEALAFTAPAKPGIVFTYAENLSSTSADLHAQIKPNGANTTYHFEYDTRPYGEGEGAHGASIPVPDEPIGAGGPTGAATESVLQHSGPLTPGTTYYYRVVASNTQGITTGAVCEGKAVVPDCTFTTLPASVSSERGYELVTPADKQGGSDMFAQPLNNGTIQNTLDVGIPADNGEGFLLRTESGFGAFPFAFTNQYVFKREAQKGGWSYTSLAASSLGTQQASAELPPAAADLSRVTLDDAVGSIAGEEGITVMSLTGPPGATSICQGPVSLRGAEEAHCYINVHQDRPKYNAQAFGAGTGATKFVGASETLGTMILETHEPSTCDPEEKIEHGGTLCEFSETQPALGLVNTAPGEEAVPTSQCGARLGAGNSAGLAHGAVSSDGSRVFFTAPDPQAQNKGAGCWNGDPNPKGEGSPLNAPQLYARVATGEGAHEVLKVSEPEPGLTEPGSNEPKQRPTAYPAVYVGASTDGSRVFFLTETWITQNHPEGHDAELYECEIVAQGEGYGCQLSRLSAGEPTSEGEKDEGAKEGAHVMFVPAVAAQGTSVYFTAFNALTEHAKHYPVMDQSHNGEVNLYRYNLETRRTSYITTVDTFDYSDEPECATGISVETGVESETGSCNEPNWYTTPDGRYLLFGASTEVEGYNKVAAGCAEQTLPRAQGHQDGRCSELYRYDAVAGEHGEPAIVCVSCGSGSADSAGNAEFARSSPADASSGAVRGMSDNGEYVFFDSQASLVSGASNGTLDTYQWREDLATHERSISLVGSGTDTAPTFFLGYSPYEYTDSHGKKVKVEAGNVFIGTHAKLSPVQTNSVGNIYDARACEPESPCIEPPASETAQCLAGECQKPPPLPLFQTPASLTIVRNGNIAPVPPALPPKPLTKAQKLANALRSCRKDRKKSKRVACEKQAKKKYGVAKKSSKKKGK